MPKDPQWFDEAAETLEDINARLKEQGYSKEERDRILRKVCGTSKLEDNVIIRSLRGWFGLDK